MMSSGLLLPMMMGMMLLSQYNQKPQQMALKVADHWNGLWMVTKVKNTLDGTSAAEPVVDDEEGEENIQVVQSSDGTFNLTSLGGKNDSRLYGYYYPGMPQIRSNDRATHTLQINTHGSLAGNFTMLKKRKVDADDEDEEEEHVVEIDDDDAEEVPKKKKPAEAAVDEHHKSEGFDDIRFDFDFRLSPTGAYASQGPWYRSDNSVGGTYHMTVSNANQFILIVSGQAVSEAAAAEVLTFIGRKSEEKQQSFLSKWGPTVLLMAMLFGTKILQKRALGDPAARGRTAPPK